MFPSVIMYTIFFAHCLPKFILGILSYGVLLISAIIGNSSFIKFNVLFVVDIVYIEPISPFFSVLYIND